MKKLLFGFLFCFLSTAGLMAQTGAISGKVIDERTGEELLGATVVIKGTTQGVTTDLSGNYTIKNVAAGTYTLVFSFMSYGTKEVTEIVVTAGKITTVDAALKEVVLELTGDVVITAKHKQETASALLIAQKNAFSIGNGVSGDIIRKSAASNSGDVIRQVSGATIQGGKFAVIRGLNDRYNAAMINGSPLPSTEPERRAFSFDLFPSNMLDQLVVIKSATPDLPGDFAGGIIQLVTKETPSIAFFSVSLSGGFNSLTTFREFKTYKGSSTDVLGFDNGTRTIPEGFPSTEYLRQGTNFEKADKEIEAAKKLNNNYAILSSTALPNSGLQISGGKTYTWEKSKLGVIYSFNYGRSSSFQPVEKSWYDNAKNPMFQYTDSSYEENVKMGALLNLSYEFRDNHKITLKNTLHMNGEDVMTLRRGPSQAEGIYKKAYSYAYTQNRMILSQLNGEHLLPKSKIRLNWEHSRGFVNRDIPDYKNVEYRGTSPENLELAVINTANENAARLFTSLTERLSTYGYSASIPLSFIDKKYGTHTFKAGGFHQFKNRDFNARMMGFAIARISSFDQSLRTLPVDQVFNYEYMSVNGFRLNDITNPSHKYDASSRLHAGYAMFQNNIATRWKFIWGVRFESYNQQMVSATRNGEEVNINTTFNDFLPSANIVYSITAKTNLRAGVSKTVSRPELRELAPFSFYDFSTFSSLEGNSNLQRAVIKNYDLRIETYPNSGEVLSAALFYKDFTNPIELLLANDISLGVIRRTFVNLPRAKSYGVEFDFRKNIGKRLTAFGNFSYILSDIEISGNSNRWNENRPMQGQSPYIVNLGTLYAIDKINLDVSLMYNIYGDRVYNVGNSSFPDIYEAARHVVDVQVSKRFFNKKLETKVSVSDLFAPDLIFYMDFSKNSRYDKTDDKAIFRYKMPRIFSLSVNYKL